MWQEKEKFLGSIVIADTVKGRSKRGAIASMKKVGVKKCVMLTGDRKEAAEGSGRARLIDEVHAQRLARPVKRRERDREALAFVGDGIKRCASAHQSGYRHCNGKHGLLTRRLRRQIGSDGRRHSEDCRRSCGFQKDTRH